MSAAEPKTALVLLDPPEPALADPVALWLAAALGIAPQRVTDATALTDLIEAPDTPILLVAATPEEAVAAALAAGTAPTGPAIADWRARAAELRDLLRRGGGRVTMVTFDDLRKQPERSLAHIGHVTQSLPAFPAGPATPLLRRLASLVLTGQDDDTETESDAILQRLLALQKDMLHRKQALSERDAKLAEMRISHDKEVLQINQQITERDAELAAMRLSHDTQMQRRNQELAQRDAELAEMRLSRDNAAKALSQVKAQYEASQQQVRAGQARIEALKAEVLAANAAMHALLNSRSMRVTRPLRWIQGRLSSTRN